MHCQFKLLSVLFLVSWSSFIFCQDKEVDVHKIQLNKLIQQGRQFYDDGMSDRAFENFAKAKMISESLGFKELSFVASIELANIYLMRSESAKAEILLRSISPDPKFKPEINCQYYHRLAFFYNQNGKTDSAKIQSLKALSIADKHGVKGIKGVVFNELGYVSERNFLYDTALVYYNKARSEFDKKSYDYANATYNFSRIYYHLEMYDSVVYYLAPLLNQIEDSHWYLIKSPGNHFLTESYFKLNDSLSAYIAQEKSLRAELEIIKTAHGTNLENLKMAYDTEGQKIKINSQAALLDQEREEKTVVFRFAVILGTALLFIITSLFIIRKKNRKLKKLLKENEFLVGEANHRIKNNLQVIVSLVAREMSKKEDQEIDALRNLGSKIESIATLHQQMYINEEKDEINLSKYLSNLTENLEPIYSAKGIQLEIELDEMLSYSVSKSIYLGLLFNELIINSIKHGFNDSSTNKIIKADFKVESGGKIKFEYSDNGVGIKDAKKPKLIDMMCRQLKSKYEIWNENGFHFKVIVKP